MWYCQCQFSCQVFLGLYFVDCASHGVQWLLLFFHSCLISIYSYIVRLPLTEVLKVLLLVDSACNGFECCLFLKIWRPGRIRIYSGQTLQRSHRVNLTHKFVQNGGSSHISLAVFLHSLLFHLFCLSIDSPHKRDHADTFKIYHKEAQINWTTFWCDRALTVKSHLGFVHFLLTGI